jgi:hypothetical protein
LTTSTNTTSGSTRIALMDTPYRFVLEKQSPTQRPRNIMEALSTWMNSRQ